MKVDDLVKQLAVMFPNALTGDGIAAWYRPYREALERYEGAALRAGFDEVLSAWKYPSPPKPADFAEAADRWRARNSLKRVVEAFPTETGSNGRAARVRAAASRLIDSWLMDNAQWLDDWIAAFPADDRRFARSHVVWMLESRAHRIAQGAKEELRLSRDDLEHIKLRVASQRPARAVLLKLPPEPNLMPAREIFEEAIDGY